MENNGRNGFSAERVVRISLEDELERETIRGAYIDLLKKFRGNVTQLRRSLGIPHQSIYNKLKRYNINPADYRRKLSE